MRPSRALAAALVWTIALSACLPRRHWSDEEVANIRHLFASYKANREAIRISKAGESSHIDPEEIESVIELNDDALWHAQRLSDDVLDKAHPELVWHFRGEYQRGLELQLEALRDGDVAKSITAVVLHDRWVLWWRRNRRHIHLPQL